MCDILSKIGHILSGVGLGIAHTQLSHPTLGLNKQEPENPPPLYYPFLELSNYWLAIPNEGAGRS